MEGETSNSQINKSSNPQIKPVSRIRLVLVGLILVMVAGGSGYVVGERVGRVKGLSGVKTLDAVLGKTPQTEKADFSLFWEVWQRLEESYLEPVKLIPQQMVYGAIKGMTAALDDPYTAFLPPEENEQTKEDLAGEFAGVGIQLGYMDKTLAVMAPLKGHPAEKAGIRAGDLILNIKDAEKGLDQDTEGMSMMEAVQAIRGKKGTTVVLTIFSEGEEDTREVSLVRDTIVVPSVELSWVDEGGKKNEQGLYAHLEVVRFGEKTMEEWNDAVGEIVARKGMKGVILDVRNNPGGFLQRAIDLSSEFMSEGVVVQQQGRTETETFSVNRRGRLIGVPLVVLVNKGSASASEILAGALRDQLKVKLVGVHTFGKGTVQEAQELSGGAGLHVTIAKWLLPSGANIHKEGLEPDVTVEDVRQKEGEEEVDEQLRKAVEVVRG